MRHQWRNPAWGLTLALAFVNLPDGGSRALAQGKGVPKPPQVHLPHLQNQGASAKLTQKDVELTLDENVTVRRQFPPTQYDAQGKPRQATQTELRELKGTDPKLPGYKADVADIHPDQFLQVTLYKKKDDKKEGDKAKANPPAAAKPADDKNASKPDTEGWVLAGTLSGKVTKYEPSSQKITLRVESVNLNARHHHNVNTGKNKITMPDHKVTLMMILGKDQPPKEEAAKKK